MQIAASLVAPLTDSNDYAGVGLSFNSMSCLDASMYSGVAFDLSGDPGGCALVFGISSTESVRVTDDAVRGACVPAATACYAPTLTVVPGASTIHVPFTSLTAGMPADKVDATTIVTVQWQVQAPRGPDAGGCAANVTVANVAFY